MKVLEATTIWVCDQLERVLIGLPVWVPSGVALVAGVAQLGVVFLATIKIIMS